MQFATSRWLPALVMQWLKLVKTLVLPATKVPTRMENAILTASARMPHTSPAAACPGFAVPPARPRVSAATPMAAATTPPTRPSGSSTNDSEATRLATPSTRAAVPRPFFDRADGDMTGVLGDSMLTMGPPLPCAAWQALLRSRRGLPHRRSRPTTISTREEQAMKESRRYKGALTVSHPEYSLAPNDCGRAPGRR